MLCGLATTSTSRLFVREDDGTEVVIEGMRPTDTVEELRRRLNEAGATFNPDDDFEARAETPPLPLYLTPHNVGAQCATTPIVARIAHRWCSVRETHDRASHTPYIPW